jgi:hypothetical protein
MYSPYAGQGSIIVPPHKVRASTPWGKRNPNTSRSQSGVVTITDRDGNTRTVSPVILSSSGVVRLPRNRARKVRLSGENIITLDLNEDQERAILDRLKSARSTAINNNIHNK